MAIFFEDRVTRGQVRAHPDRLYVFGDNLERAGYERPTWAGEANAIGIPTKRAPSVKSEAYFADEDFDARVTAAKPAWDRIERVILDGKTVVFPKDRLGTEFAWLPDRAPRIKLAIGTLIETLEKIDRHVQAERQTSPVKGLRRG